MGGSTTFFRVVDFTFSSISGMDTGLPSWFGHSNPFFKFDDLVSIFDNRAAF